MTYPGFLTLFLFLTLPYPLISQHQAVFPDLSGPELTQQLRQTFRPATVLPFSDARDTLFARVYARNDTLICVYSGHRLYLDPEQDPTQAAFQNGALWGINTEHTWPQAFGADGGNPRADMHHLHPTRIAVNAARDNRPFADIPDQQTDEWFYLTQTQFSVPVQQIDLYSEKDEDAFEPREDHKGNVARAMFYFYTIYNEEAVAANPDFFELQRETLCRWHFQDPVDALEWERTWQIAAYQDDKANPFVLDCTLPERSYCQDVGQSCDPVISSLKESLPGRMLLIHPNPLSHSATLSYSIGRPAVVNIALFDMMGRKVTTLVDERQPAGSYDASIFRQLLPDLSGGMLICRMRLDGEYVESRILVLE